MLGEGMITYAVLAVLAILVLFLLVQVFLLRSNYPRSPGNISILWPGRTEAVWSASSRQS